MYCMKCGRETIENRIFCEECQSGMAAYPVKPGTPVQLPSRPTPAAVRKASPRRKIPTAAEQIEKLRRTVRWLVVCVFVLIAALCFTVVSLVRTLDVPDSQHTIGQNYSILNETDGK